MTTDFKIGDNVWLATCGTNLVKKTCPICFGKLKVRVILGDESQVETPCEACSKGYEGAQGMVEEYEWEAKPELVTITGVNIRQTSLGNEIEYQTYRRGSFESDKVFATKEESEKVCAQEVLKQAADEKRRLEWNKEKTNKTYAWHVRYHLREAKDAQRKLEWHSARAVFCKARAKTEVTEVKEQD